MRKLLLLLVSLSFAVSSYGEQLVAGWSFVGANPRLSASYSDLLPDASVGASQGSFLFDGSYGTTDITGAGGAGVVYQTVAGGISQALDIATRPSAQDFTIDSYLRLDNYSALPLNSFAVQINAGQAMTDWRLSYGTEASGDGVDVNWAYSIDGGSSFSSFADVNTVSATAVNQNITSAAASSIILKATLSGFSAGSPGESLGIDNFAVLATVPEPSTYALIIGFTAFLFVAIKRRK